MNNNGSGSATENSPMPAYRDPGSRREVIRHLVGILVQRDPSLFDDVSVLTQPPAVDQQAIDAGYGPYGHDFTRNIWNRLATDVVATEEELRDALSYHLARVNGTPNQVDI